jgi:hypothetical protein
MKCFDILFARHVFRRGIVGTFMLSKRRRVVDLRFSQQVRKIKA